MAVSLEAEGKAMIQTSLMDSKKGGSIVFYVKFIEFI